MCYDTKPIDVKNYKAKLSTCLVGHGMMRMDSADVEVLLNIARERLHGGKLSLPHKEAKTWDVRARQFFFRTMIEILRERYGMSEDLARKHVYVEGLNPFNLGCKGGRVFGSNLYPDAMIMSEDGRKIAVELDHGTKGSQIKDALARKAMLKLVGDFDRVAVYFFVYPPLTVDIGDAEQRVLEFYQKSFSTRIFFV